VDQQRAITDTRANLVTLLAAIGVVGTFAYTARSYALNRAGQLTDRYSKAIEQLGADSFDVRMGGIYALEQLANDSPRKRDKDTVVDVLSAFVRVHSDPVHRWRSHLKLHEQAAELRNVTRQEEQHKADSHVREFPLPGDVQAAASVLAQLRPSRRVQKNFEMSWLDGIQLPKAHLAGARLTKATLTNADLTGAHLENAILTETILTGADLSEVTVTEGALTDEQLKSARNSDKIKMVPEK